MDVDETLNIGVDFDRELADQCCLLINSRYLCKEDDYYTCSRQKMTIRLTDSTPFHCPPRRLSYYKREK